MSAPEIAARYCQRLTWDQLGPSAIDDMIRRAQAEDLEGWGLRNPSPSVPDPGEWIGSTSSIKSARATLVARGDMVLAGISLGSRILAVYDPQCSLNPLQSDGAACSLGTALGIVSGPASAILRAERVLLNFLQRLSGVATLTRKFVDAMGNTTTRLLDTRKTTPGLRALEKYAVTCGGGWNHRMGLFDRIMLKDNHLAAADARSGTELFQFLQSCARQWQGVPLQLEVDEIEQIQPALDAGIELFLLDNFSTADLEAAVALVGPHAATEASGTISLERIPELSHIGLDFISTGATIHQSTWVDIGLDWNF